MIHRQTVIYNGAEYLLLYRCSRQASQSWALVDALRLNPVEPEDVPRLRDLYLAQASATDGRPADLEELRRLYDVLLAMGADHTQIRRRFGTNEPRRCVDCCSMTIDGYPGPRCKPCHKTFVRTARLRNAGLYDVSGGRMSGSRRG